MRMIVILLCIASCKNVNDVRQDAEIDQLRHKVEEIQQDNHDLRSRMRRLAMCLQFPVTDGSMDRCAQNWRADEKP